MNQLDRIVARSVMGVAAATVIVASLLAAGPALAQLGGTTQPVSTLTLGPFQPFFFRGDLRDLPTVRGWQPGDSIKDVPDKRGWPIELRQPANATSWTEDPLRVQQRRHDNQTSPTPTLTGPLHNFDGIDFQGVNPSDPAIDVGK
ncbi:MAG TPA: hypothetical protein VF756_15070, partial [Thermoanaerobaculia bacterium]